MTNTELFLGIDVSKHHLDAASFPEVKRLHVEYDTGGLRELLAWAKSLSPVLIVLEATGGFEKVVTAELAAADLQVVVVNPRQVRDFAKACNILAKNDRLDALVLARFGQSVRPTLRPIRDASTEALGE